MRDVCIVTEGAWPARTGGVSTWAQQVLRALDGAEASVISLGAASWSSGEFAIPRAARDVEVLERLRFLPRARVYIASGLASAEAVLRAAPSLAHRMVYVEHGDAVREALLGGAVSESGALVARSRRGDAARSVAARREAVTTACGAVIGVTTATTRRARAQGALRVRCVPNAVPAGERPARSGRGAGFVGRFSRVKGIDRFVALARRSNVGSVAIGMPAGEPWGEVGVEWRLARGCPWREADFSALLMPSRLEASPFAALEAEARGIPVILSDRASLRASSLVRRVPWGKGRWGRALDAALRGGVCPEMGARIAAGRWGRFVSAWRALVERGPMAIAPRR